MLIGGDGVLDNQTPRDKQAIADLDKAVAWFGVKLTIEILEEYNQDFEGLRG